MNKCPYCGSDEFIYAGVTDIGTSLVDQWRCEDCGEIFDGEPFPYDWSFLDETSDDTKPTNAVNDPD